MSDALERETLRLMDRYAREVVEAYNLCPWAAEVRKSGRLFRQILMCSAVDEAIREASETIERLAGDQNIDVALLAFPRLEIGRRDFRVFVAELEKAHARASKNVVFAMAAFHPCAEADLSSPAKLIPFLRRAPVPLVQLVRRTALARARGTADEGSQFAKPADALAALLDAKKPRPSVSDSIALGNLRTVERVGPATLEAVYRDIREDLDEDCEHAAPRTDTLRP